VNKRLRKYLTETETPPEAVALKLGCSVTTLNRLDETKPPKKKSLGIALATVTGLTWADLFPSPAITQKAQKKAG